MDEVIEFILELIVEGVITVGENKKISRWIRYPLMILILLLVLGINGLCFLLGIMALKEKESGFNLLGIILIGCGIVFLFNVVKRVKKYWNEENNETSKIGND